jgi:hypothetical protein
MTLLTPEVVWPWPDHDSIVALDPLVWIEWRRRGDSHKWLAYDPDAWHALGRDATPLWLLKVGADAVAERLTYLIARLIDLPCQHVFWGAADDMTIAAIRFIPDACSMRRLHHRQDGSPYVIVRRRRVRVQNERDCIGHVALQLLFMDLDGGECLIDPAYGIIVRVDGAFGHMWASQALILAKEEDPDGAPQLIRQQREVHRSHGLDWPGDDAARAAFHMFASQTRDRLHAGPKVDETIHTIKEASYIPDEHRPIMLRTLRVLAACDELPKKVADGFRAAPSSSVRYMADGLERGLTAMCTSLTNYFSSDSYAAEPH